MTGERLAKYLTKFGIPCKFYKVIKAPKNSYYYFTITDYSHFTPATVKSAIYKLSAASGKDFQQVDKLIQGANFGIFCADDNKQVLLSDMPRQIHNGLTFCAGIDENGDYINISLSKMIHCLIAGTTGSGKTVFLKSTIYQLCRYNNNIRFYLIDKKQSILFLAKAPQFVNYATDDKGAISILEAVRAEMFHRFEILKLAGIENGAGYFPHICIVIDELADLMLSAERDKIKDLLTSIAQLSRAAQISLILCTQSPRTAILDGLLLANIPTKISFRTASTRESVIIFGHKGTEKLLGNGDGLLKLPDSITETRFQAPFLPDKDFRELYNQLGE